MLLHENLMIFYCLLDGEHTKAEAFFSLCSFSCIRITVQ